MNISVKDIDEQAWRQIRIESIKHGMNTGEFIAKACLEHVKHEEEGHSCEFFSNKRTLKTDRRDVMQRSLKRAR
ncbi:hypothetical protein HY641_01620 [Candidatus Woesearchaeota archaeon]|nr:hypothetical protein [Candidatus Woesearchaeota archaeon]